MKYDVKWRVSGQTALKNSGDGIKTLKEIHTLLKELSLSAELDWEQKLWDTYSTAYWLERVVELSHCEYLLIPYQVSDEDYVGVITITAFDEEIGLPYSLDV